METNILLQLGHWTGVFDVLVDCTSPVGREIRHPWHMPLSIFTTGSDMRDLFIVSYRFKCWEFIEVESLERYSRS